MTLMPGTHPLRHWCNCSGLGPRTSFKALRCFGCPAKVEKCCPRLLTRPREMLHSLHVARLFPGGGLVPLYFTTSSFSHCSAYSFPISPGRPWASWGGSILITSVGPVPSTAQGSQWMLSVEEVAVCQCATTPTGCVWVPEGSAHTQFSWSVPLSAFGHCRNYSSGLSPLVMGLSFQISTAFTLYRLKTLSSADESEHEPYQSVWGSQVQQMPLEFSLRRAVNATLTASKKCWIGWNLTFANYKNHFYDFFHLHDACCII